MNKFYGFVRNIVKSGLGMSVKDVMETDWRDLLSIINSADDKPKENQEVLSLEEFIGKL